MDIGSLTATGSQRLYGKRKATLRQQVERLTEAYLAGIVQLPEYQRRRGELDTRDAGLEQQAKELSARVDRQKEISDMAASIEDLCRRIQTGLTNASFAQRRILVQLLVDRAWRSTIKLRSDTSFLPMPALRPPAFVICVKTISTTLFSTIARAFAGKAGRSPSATAQHDAMPHRRPK